MGLAVPSSRGALDSSQGVGALVMVRSGSTIHFVTQDPLGNVAGLVNSAAGSALHARFEYSPFGELLQASKLVDNAQAAAAAACPIRFSNQYWDSESGLSYYGYRYYSPSLGRWINRDPIGESGGLNLYGFVRNRPVNRVDRLGLAESNLATLLRELAQKPGYLLRRLIWDDEEMDYVRVPYTVWPENQARWMTVPVPAENAGYDKLQAAVDTLSRWGETATYALLPAGRLGKMTSVEVRLTELTQGQELKCLCDSAKILSPEVQVYKLSLATKLTPSSTPAGLYEIANTGKYNYLIEGADARLWADGLIGVTIQESKYIGNANRSPFIRGSSAPDFIRNEIVQQVDDEFARMAKIIADPCNPLKNVEVIVSDPAANQFFIDLLNKHKLDGRVINR